MLRNLINLPVVDHILPETMFVNGKTHIREPQTSPAPRIIRRMGFCEAGYLPKRARRIRRGK